MGDDMIRPPASRWTMICGLSVLLAGCATIQQSEIYQKTSEIVGKAVDVVEAGAAKAIPIAKQKAKEARVRMDRYLTEKDVLKKFHDSAALGESQVLSVLHQAGISGGGKAGGRHKGKPSPPGEAVSKSPTGEQLPAVPSLYTGDYRWPLDAGIVSSEYGRRWGKLHKGLDIAADTGEPVYAIADGVVIYADNKMRGYGNVVVIRHDEKRSSLYAHNSELKVKTGDEVKQGDVVALLGSTGHSTGPHTHFEIRDGDAPLAPRSLLPAVAGF